MTARIDLGLLERGVLDYSCYAAGTDSATGTPIS